LLNWTKKARRWSLEREVRKVQENSGGKEKNTVKEEESQYEGRSLPSSAELRQEKVKKRPR